jgi:hypothetical protein
MMRLMVERDTFRAWAASVILRRGWCSMGRSESFMSAVSETELAEMS